MKTEKHYSPVVVAVVVVRSFRCWSQFFLFYWFGLVNSFIEIQYHSTLYSNILFFLILTFVMDKHIFDLHISLSGMKKKSF